MNSSHQFRPVTRLNGFLHVSCLNSPFILLILLVFLSILINWFRIFQGDEVVTLKFHI